MDEKNEPKRRRYRIGDPDFKAPDGGWGWLVVFACGFSNLSTFPMFQQFGIIFREKFETYGISNTETTTILNMNSAFNACVGLLNGPLFRRFSYRQVALFGATLVSTSLFFSGFCSSFWSYLIIYSMCYGSGIGITQSSNALALNTYFKKKRRLATCFSWSTTGLGPIIWPYIITALMSLYGTEGTLMLFAAFAGHAIVCSLLLQPVHWHTEYREEEEAPLEEPLEWEPMSLEYDITNPGTPRLVGANDGYYSILSSKASTRAASRIASRAISTRPSCVNLKEMNKKRSLGISILKEDVERKLTELGIEKEVLKPAAQKLKEFKALEEPSMFEKICLFFDFDLLKDAGYLNLMLGITIANFAELNFSVLTPFVLQEFNFEKYQIATFMSLLGATDIFVRLVIGFVSEKIGWDNKTFFLFGVLNMAFGRIVHTQTYGISLLVAVIIGFGKGLRTIFMALVIPSYVPLERLPAASGLQLATSGLLFLVMGPVVGWVRDTVNNYVITLHLLNIMTYITAIAWTLEEIWSRKRRNDEKSGSPALG